MKLSKKYKVLNLSNIKAKFDEKYNNFKKSLKRKFVVDDPFFEDKELLEDREKKIDELFIPSLEKDLEGFEHLKLKAKNFIDTSYFEKEIEKLQEKRANFKGKKLAFDTNKRVQKDIKLLKTLLLEKWKENIQVEYQSWKDSVEQSETDKFKKEIEKWLEELEELYEDFAVLESGAGSLFDLSQGNLEKQDLKTLQEYARYIKNNKNVKRLCDMLGRVSKASKQNKQKLAKVTKEITTVIQKTTSIQEISGLRLDNSLEYALPFELSLLDDEDFSILFDKKYIEKSLLCFDSNSLVQIDEEKVDLLEEETLINIQEDEQKGPIILCVDTSGSMSGTPEAIAKALTLYIASRAKEQKRKCFLINFSTSIEVFDFDSKLGLKDLIKFLQKSFHGGTDITPALEYAIKKTFEENYKKADVVMISDFIIDSLSKDLEKKILLAKEQKNRFFSIIIGSYNNSTKTIFDKEWIFDPHSHDILELENISKEF